jgi:hypothetical protein
VIKKFIITVIDPASGERINLLKNGRSYGNKGSATNAMNNYARNVPVEADIALREIEVVSKKEASEALEKLSLIFKGVDADILTLSLETIERYIREQI